MIGVSPQEVNLDKFLTVEETLLFHAGYYGVSRKKARERAEELLRALRTRGRSAGRGRTRSRGDEAARAVRQGRSCTTRRCCSWMSRRRV